jgi:hypothetical protein
MLMVKRVLAVILISVCWLRQVSLNRLIRVLNPYICYSNFCIRQNSNVYSAKIMKVFRLSLDWLV